MYGVSTVYFWIMPGKCLDQVGTKFGLVFFVALYQSVVFLHPFTLAVYIKEQKMPQKSPQEPYLLECGGIRGYNARKSFNLT